MDDAVRRASVTVGATALGAVALVGWALPATVRFLPHAPTQFWAITGVALLVDTPLAGTGSRTEIRPRTTLSVAPTLAVFLGWGAGPAIVVAAVATTVSATVQRFHPVGSPAFIARQVLALGFTILVAQWLAHPAVRPAVVRGADVPTYLALAVAWSVVVVALFGVSAIILIGRGLVGTWRLMREDVLVNAAAILVVLPLLVTVDPRWSWLAAAPLLVRNLLTRDQLRRVRHRGRDPRTGLLTTLGLTELLQELTLTDHLQAPTPFAVLLVDGDPGQLVRRRLGAELADRVTGQLAARLAAAYGERTVGLLPEEGFVVVLPDLTRAAAAARAARAVALIDEPIEVEGIPFVADGAGGVALSPEHGRDLPGLVHKAGLALEQARRLGETVQLHVGRDEQRTGRRLALLAELHAALRDPGRAHEITVVYQPQIEVGTGHLVGVEGLLRWTHPRWGPVRPDEIIEAVETSEVMHVLTRRVLRTAAAQVRAWQEHGLSVRLAVNISVEDLRDPAFVETVAATVHQTGIRPNDLTIEITERIATGDDPVVLRTAQRIAELGLGLSVDDFGTGHASLRELREFPVTELKIDRSYVSRMVSDPADHAIVTSIHQLARVLELEVVAEGVEDEPTATALAQLPGVIGQGWYFAKPMSAADLERYASPRGS